MKLILDHSATHVWRTCKRKYYWTYVRHLDPGRSDAMERGRAAHEGLYVWARTRDVELALDSVVIERPEGMLPQEEPKYKDLELTTRELVRGYIKQLGTDDDFEVEAVELPIAAPLDDNVAYVGIIDALVKSKVLGRYVHEYKTSATIPSDWVARFQIDAQTTGYVWLVRRLGIEVRGAILSILRATKYPDYVRDAVNTPDWLLREFEDELRQTADEIQQETKWPKTTSACFQWNQPCPFHKLCTEPPEVREQLIQEGFYKKRAPREEGILARAVKKGEV